MKVRFTLALLLLFVVSLFSVAPQAQAKQQVHTKTAVPHRLLQYDCTGTPVCQSGNHWYGGSGAYGMSWDVQVSDPPLPSGKCGNYGHTRMVSTDGGGDGEPADAANESGYEVVPANCSEAYCQKPAQSTQQMWFYWVQDTVDPGTGYFVNEYKDCLKIDSRDQGITQRFAWWTYSILTTTCIRFQYTGTYTGLIGDDLCTDPGTEGMVDPDYYNQSLTQTWHMLCSNHCVWGVNETRNFWRDGSGNWRLQGNPANTCPGQVGCPYVGGSDGSPLWYWFKKPGQDNNGGEFYWCLYQTYPQVNGRNVCVLGS